ncbi:hypothetical protein V8E53_000047 [Lactarius tabidus]
MRANAWFPPCTEWPLCRYHRTAVASSEEGVEARNLGFRVLGHPLHWSPAGHSTRRPKVGYQDELPRTPAAFHLDFRTLPYSHTHNPVAYENCASAVAGSPRRGARSHAEVSLGGVGRCQAPRSWLTASPRSLSDRRHHGVIFAAPASNKWATSKGFYVPTTGWRFESLRYAPPAASTVPILKHDVTKSPKVRSVLSLTQHISDSSATVQPS